MTNFYKVCNFDEVITHEYNKKLTHAEKCIPSGYITPFSQECTYLPSQCSPRCH